MLKNKNIKTILFGITFFVTAIIRIPQVAAVSSVGAVNTYFSLSDATTLSVNMKPNYGEEGYHFYSLSPFFQGQSYGLYAGIQTNGNLGDGADVGNVFIFSVWNATAAYPENGSTATPFGGEGVGYSLRKAYDWQVGKTYTVNIRRESLDAGSGGYRWSATITQGGSSLKIGEILAPPAATGMATGAVFHERYSGSSPSCSGGSTSLEKASVTFSGLTSDKSVGFYSGPTPNGIFADATCDAFSHAHRSGSTVYTGLGLTESEFNALYAAPAPAPKPSAPKPSTLPAPAPKTETKEPEVEQKPAEETVVATPKSQTAPAEDTSKTVAKKENKYIPAVAAGGTGIVATSAALLYMQSKSVINIVWLGRILRIFKF